MPKIIKGKGHEKVKSKYNLAALADDYSIPMTEIAKDIGISYVSITRYLNGGVSPELNEEIEEWVLSTTDNPEEYLFAVKPYTPGNHRKGRKPGSKNKHSKVRNIPTEEYQEKKDSTPINMKQRKIIVSDLNTPEDIMDALINGKKVYTEDSSYYFQKVNKFIVKFSYNGGPVFLSPAIDLKAKYILKEEEPFEIKNGKTFITKGNELVTFFSCDNSMVCQSKEKGIRVQGILYSAIMQGSGITLKYDTDGKSYCWDTEINSYVPMEITAYDLIGEKL